MAEFDRKPNMNPTQSNLEQQYTENTLTFVAIKMKVQY